MSKKPMQAKHLYFFSPLTTKQPPHFSFFICWFSVRLIDDEIAYVAAIVLVAATIVPSVAAIALVIAKIVQVDINIQAVLVILILSSAMINNCITLISAVILVAATVIAPIATIILIAPTVRPDDPTIETAASKELIVCRATPVAF